VNAPHVSVQDAAAQLRELNDLGKDLSDVVWDER
jgi:hypothetical protein